MSLRSNIVFFRNASERGKRVSTEKYIQNSNFLHYPIKTAFYQAPDSIEYNNRPQLEALGDKPSNLCTYIIPHSLALRTVVAFDGTQF